MNAGEGAFQLSHLHDQLIKKTSSKDGVTLPRLQSAASQVTSLRKHPDEIN